MHHQLGGRLFAKTTRRRNDLSLTRRLNSNKRLLHCRNLKDVVCILDQDILLEKVVTTQGSTLKLTHLRPVGRKTTKESQAT